MPSETITVQDLIDRLSLLPPDLKNGARIEIFRFTQPDKEGEYGMNIRFFSSPKAGKRTLLKFALTDEAAAQTHAILSEFFGICTCA